jgi:ABC-type multidrug transport system permease subunit
MTTAWGQVLPEETPGQHGDFGYYLFAAIAGGLAGWVDIKVGDLLLTALVVLATCMLLGVFRPARPWRWVAIVAIMLPLADLLGYLVLTQKPSRAQIYESLLAFLPATAGAYGGALMRGAMRNISGGK